MRILENKKPISESKLWQLLTNYYLNKGPSAWTAEETPSFVTTSCYIAHYYAQIIIHALQDWHHQRDGNSSNNPFYIIELSSGLGEFAFHCLKQLTILQKLYQLTEVKFCYVLTDVVKENIVSWENSNAFADYIAKGQVDFAHYDITNPQLLLLTQQKLQLDPQHLNNPIIVIANYIFDSVPCDAYYLSARQLQRGLISITVPKDFVEEDLQNLAKINTQIHYQAVDDANIYPEAIFNQIMENYRQTFARGVINFPLAALRYLQYLLDNSSGKMLLLIADKGYSTQMIMQDIERFHIDYHTSLSVLVNFHAIEQFFKLRQGDSFYQDRFTTLTTAIYTAGMTWQNMPVTQHFLQVYQHEVSPQEYCRLVSQFSQIEHLDALSMLALFRLTKNDPFLLSRYYTHLLQMTNPYKLNFNYELRQLVQQLSDNIYPLRRTPELNFLLGCMHHVLGDYQAALSLLIAYTPSSKFEYDYYQRLQDCYLQLGEEEQADALAFKLRLAKIRYNLNIFLMYLNKLKKWLQKSVSMVILTGFVIILIYFIIRYVLSL